MPVVGGFRVDFCVCACSSGTQRVALDRSVTILGVCWARIRE